MPLQIYKDNISKDVTPIINNGTNIYEPLVYDSNKKMYGPLSSDMKIIWSYSNRNSNYSNDCTTVNDNKHYAYWGNIDPVGSNCMVLENSRYYTDPGPGGGPPRYNGLNFARIQPSNGSLTNGLASANGTGCYVAGDWNNNRLTQHLSGSTGQSTTAVTGNFNKMWDLRPLTADSIIDRKILANSIVSIPADYCTITSKQFTNSFNNPASWNLWKINGSNIYVNGKFNITANVYMPKYQLGIGFKGGNIIVSTTGVVTAGRSKLTYSTALYDVYTSNSKYNYGTTPNTENLWYVKYLGQDPIHNYNSLWKFSASVSLKSFYYGAGESYRPSAISSPMIGLKHPNFGLRDSQTWRISAHISGLSSTNSSGTNSNTFTANTSSRYFTQAGTESIQVDYFTKYIVNYICRNDSIVIRDLCWGIA